MHTKSLTDNETTGKLITKLLFSSIISMIITEKILVFMHLADFTVI